MTTWLELAGKAQCYADMLRGMAIRVRIYSAASPGWHEYNRAQKDADRLVEVCIEEARRAGELP